MSRAQRWGVPALAVGLALLNEALTWAGEKAFYEGRAFPGLQALYLGAWDLGLLAWFAWGQRSRRQFRRGAWLAVFWVGQLAWLGLGLWVLAGPLGRQPIAVGGAPAWLLGAFAWALLVEHLDHPPSPAAPLPEDSPYTDVLKALSEKAPKKR